MTCMGDTTVLYTPSKNILYAIIIGNHSKTTAFTKEYFTSVTDSTFYRLIVFLHDPDSMTPRKISK